MITGAETRLDKALRADARASRDPAFRIAVLERRERAIFRRRMLTIGAGAAGTAILLVLGFAAFDKIAGVGVEKLTLAAAAGLALATSFGAYYSARSILYIFSTYFRPSALSAIWMIPRSNSWL